MIEKLQNYIEKVIPERDALLTRMEKYAHEKGVPIMELTAIEMMLQILRIHQPTTILEVGTAIGYSALRMAYTLPEVTVVTIERDEERYKVANSFIEEAGKTNQIHVIKGDALEVEGEIKKFAPFDCLFIDAAKGQYKRFFDMYSPYLGDNGIIITDNVLFKGLVCEPNIESRNIRSLVKKINEFNHWMMSHPDYHTSIVPVGDGVAISKKR